MSSDSNVNCILQQASVQLLLFFKIFFSFPFWPNSALKESLQGLERSTQISMCSNVALWLAGCANYSVAQVEAIQELWPIGNNVTNPSSCNKSGPQKLPVSYTVFDSVLPGLHQFTSHYSSYFPLAVFDRTMTRLNESHCSSQFSSLICRSPLEHNMLANSHQPRQQSSQLLSNQQVLFPLYPPEKILSLREYVYLLLQLQTAHQDRFQSKQLVIHVSFIYYKGWPNYPVKRWLQSPFYNQIYRFKTRLK